uniref:Uncharacterized protein n=1 Tax=Panagrolaimus superbus TaxID=310955 RepID=A0A914Z689_9BILA
MNKSLLTNPAWYRDQEGRTGYKPPGINKGAKEGAEIKELNKNTKSINPKIPVDVSNYQNIVSPTKNQHFPPTSKPKQQQQQQHSKDISTLFCLSSNTNSMTTSEYENLLEANAAAGVATSSPSEQQQQRQNSSSSKNKPKKGLKKEISSSDSDDTLVEEQVTSINQKRIAVVTTKSPANSIESFSNLNTSHRDSRPESFEKQIILDARGSTRRQQFSPETNYRENIVEQQQPQPLPSSHHQRSSPLKHSLEENRKIRRDSSQSDVSKLSHKSVTFNDNVEINEIERSERRQLSVDTTSSSSDDENNDGSMIDLDEHLMPLRKALRGSSSKDTQKRYSRDAKESPPKIDHLTVTPMNGSGSDVPEVSPTPLSQSWSSNDHSTEITRSPTHSPQIQQSPQKSPQRSPTRIPKPHFQSSNFQPLPLPEKFNSLRKTATQDSNNSFELQATFPKPDGMSDEEWRTMIQSIYVTETSSNDSKNLGKDVRDDENDSIHSFYLEDIYGPDIYQHQQYFPDDEDLPETPPPGVIRSASGYLDLSQVPQNLYSHPLNIDINKHDYDASAEISPTDSKTLRKSNRFGIHSNRKLTSPQATTNAETTPTPTASQIPRPIGYQLFDNNNADIESSKRSYDSQDSARLDSLLLGRSGDTDTMYSMPKKNYQKDERAIRSLSPQSSYKISPKSKTLAPEQRPLSPLSPTMENKRSGKTTKVSFNYKDKSQQFGSSHISASTSSKSPTRTKSPLSPTRIKSPLSPTRNLSPKITNVSVNLPPSRKAVGVVTTRVIASTSNPLHLLHHPTPTAPSESQFSTLEPNSLQKSPINTKEKHFQTKFVKLYGNRKAPIVGGESENDETAPPKDPKPTTTILNERKHSYESGLSTDSRESVVSAVSFRAENKVRRYFNY